MGNGPIFVVGASRSGTTMMGRVLGGSPDVFTFRELHFFEELWSPSGGANIDREDAVKVVATLLSIERDGYLTKWKPDRYLSEARNVVARLAEPHSAIACFREFLSYEAERRGATRPCDQTPRNLFYVAEIFDHVDSARFVYMVRDPRDVLLSQKNRWKRRLRGSESHRVRDMLRDWCNYHPWTISRFWRTSEQIALAIGQEPRFARVRFEDLLADPHTTIRGVSDSLEITFSEAMLHVPVMGSSNRSDRDGAVGIDASRAAQWRKGGLNSTEIWICEKVAGRTAMARNGYEGSRLLPNPVLLVGYLLWLPVHIVLAVAMNFHRVDNLRQAVVRRLGIGMSS